MSEDTELPNTCEGERGVLCAMAKTIPVVQRGRSPLGPV